MQRQGKVGDARLDGLDERFSANWHDGGMSHTHRRIASLVGWVGVIGWLCRAVGHSQQAWLALACECECECAGPHRTLQFR